MNDITDVLTDGIFKILSEIYSPEFVISMFCGDASGHIIRQKYDIRKTDYVSVVVNGNSSLGITIIITDIGLFLKSKDVSQSATYTKFDFEDPKMFESFLSQFNDHLIDRMQKMIDLIESGTAIATRSYDVNRFRKLVSIAKTKHLCYYTKHFSNTETI